MPQIRHFTLEEFRTRALGIEIATMWKVKGGPKLDSYWTTTPTRTNVIAAAKNSSTLQSAVGTHQLQEALHELQASGQRQPQSQQREREQQQHETQQGLERTPSLTHQLFDDQIHSDAQDGDYDPSRPGTTSCKWKTSARCKIDDFDVSDILMNVRKDLVR
ncbi:hypothetical protein BGZ83_012001 [Gryganskiella cystojenkinii]|nr:hypothetical protein BGZ83_012001 [Gryganskiella cystojenkinii]